MWHNIDKEKPTEDGLIVVARFEGDEMVWYCMDWAKCEGYFGPNSASYCGERDITHWMTRTEFRKILENLPKK